MTGPRADVCIGGREAIVAGLLGYQLLDVTLTP